MHSEISVDTGSGIAVHSCNQQIAMKKTALDDIVINKIREIREEMGIGQ